MARTETAGFSVASFSHQMTTLQQVHAADCLGFTKFGEQQIRAMVDMLRRTGKLNSEPPRCHGQGIVIAGGGKYLSWSWVLVKWLRFLGCPLPIQVWHLGKDEMPAWARGELARLDTETVDALSLLPAHPHRTLGLYAHQKNWTYAGWVLKTYALAHCPFERALFLDADSFPSRDPSVVMNSPEVQSAGGLFFSDVANHAPSAWGYIHCGLTPPVREWEAGQYLVNKSRGWMGLCWANFLNEHSDVFFNLGHGDKFTLELGFRCAEVPILVSTECSWRGWGILQRWRGEDFAMHAMGAKRGEHPFPHPQIQDLFWQFEAIKPR